MLVTVGTSPDSDRPDLAPGVNYFVRSRTGDQWEVDVIEVAPVEQLAAMDPDQEARIADLETKLDAALALIAGE